jgi:hypothetical protein
VAPESAVTLRQRSQVTYVLSRNTIAAALLQGGTTDVIFDIPSNLVDYLECLYLKYTITNTDPSNALAMVDAYTMIDWITLSCNNEDIQTLYGVGIRNNIIAGNSIDRLAQILPAVGISTSSYAANVSIAAGGTNNQTFYVPLHTLLDRARLPMWRSAVQWRLTVRWKTGSQILMSTSAAAVTAVSLSSPGYCAYVWIYVNSATAANEQLYNSLALNTFEVLDNGLQTFHNLGDNQYTPAQMKLQATTEWVNTQALSQLNVYYASYSDYPSRALNTGSNYGSYKIKGSTATLRITPGATNSSAMALMFGMWYSQIHIDYAAGKFKVERQLYA